MIESIQTIDIAANSAMPEVIVFDNKFVNTVLPCETRESRHDIKEDGLKRAFAYAAPEAFDANGDNIAAVIFVNEVDGDRFREIDQIGGGR